MSVGATRLSPAANLLRNSRLFTVPTPIPPPPRSGSSQGTFDSETATLPYPTHAAIQTYPSALQKGDWGLKRPLPTKSTAKGSKSAIRIRGGIDTIEHIADFESAGDHVVTLQKWQRLHLPITKPPEREKVGRLYHSGGSQSSVFERQNDGISPTEDVKHLRWRFDGPYLQGISGLEFENYLRNVRARKVEFPEHIKTRLNERRLEAAKDSARAEARDLDESAITGVTDAEVDDHIKYLRKNLDAFGDAVSDFLDLPGGPVALTDLKSTKESLPLSRTSELSSEQYAISGPPKTHPSAGLSYLTSASYLNNHPEYGPTPHQPLIYSRVLRFDGQNDYGVYGVAGFVTSQLIDQSKKGTFGQENDRPKPRARKSETHPTINYARKTPLGGRKTFTKILQASLGSDGRLELALGRPDEVALAIYECDKPFTQQDRNDEMEDVEKRLEEKGLRKGTGSGRMGRLDNDYQTRGSQPRTEKAKVTINSINNLMMGLPADKD